MNTVIWRHSLSVCFMALLLGIQVSQAAPGGALQYRVKTGDTLSRISGDCLGSAAEWQRLLKLNPTKVKRSGHMIYPGTLLILPPGSQCEGAMPIPVAKAPEQSRHGEGTIYWATGDDYAPYVGKDLENGGMITEIVVKVSKAMGYEDADITFLSWANAYSLTKDDRGIFQGTFPWFSNEGRMAEYYFSDPVQPVFISAFSLADSGFEYTDKSDLDGKVLCRPEGYFTHDIDELVAAGSLRHEAPKDVDACFDLLLEGKVDLVSINDRTGTEQVESRGASNKIKMSETPMEIMPLHVIFPRYADAERDADSKALRDRFNSELKRLEQQGVLSEIILRHALED